MLRIGLISDTHGLLRPEALAFLQGADHLIHAGDIGDPSILDALAQVAPVTAVRGNVDLYGWDHVPEVATRTLGGVCIHVIHDVAELRGAAPGGVHVIVSGHSHRPEIAERGGVLWVNPGSAGPRRFRLPVSVAELIVRDGAAEARCIELAL